jgi:hypothetical protein
MEKALQELILTRKMICEKIYKILTKKGIAADKKFSAIKILIAIEKEKDLNAVGLY